MRIITVQGTGFSGSGLILDILSKDSNFKLVTTFRIHFSEYEKLIFNEKIKFRVNISMVTKVLFNILKVIFFYMPLRILFSFNSIKSLLNKEIAFLSIGIHKSHGVDISFLSYIADLLLIIKNILGIDKDPKVRLKSWINLKLLLHKKDKIFLFDKSGTYSIRLLNLLDEVLDYTAIVVIRNPVKQFVQQTVLKYNKNKVFTKNEYDEFVSSISLNLNFIKDFLVSNDHVRLLYFDRFLQDNSYRISIFKSILSNEFLNNLTDFIEESRTNDSSLEDTHIYKELLESYNQTKITQVLELMNELFVLNDFPFD